MEEDYADFVAFSHIVLQENGKLKARMLPLSDVVSTDTEEAGRLMYADSVLNTCWESSLRAVSSGTTIFFFGQICQQGRIFCSWRNALHVAAAICCPRQ